MAELKRSISLSSLVFYGVGTMIGGGFFALIGKVAGTAGAATPLALLLTGLLALVTAFSFAELSARFPVSAGESEYVRQAFNTRWLSICVGWLVVLTGLVSASTLTAATAGFLHDLVSLPEPVGILTVAFLIGLIAAWGIGESIGVVTVITIIEVGALLYIGGLHVDVLPSLPAAIPDMIPSSGNLDPLVTWPAIMAASFLAFYAFIGFEDMVNIAEEVKDVRRTLPIAIFIAIVITTILYVVIAAIAVQVVAPTDLAASKTPVATLAAEGGPTAMKALGIVSLLTGLNGALVQIIMAARVAYGMAKRGDAPGLFARIHAKRLTPIYATLLMTGLIMLLAWFFPLSELAKTTSTIILVVFALVNLSLFVLKGRQLDGPVPPIVIPRWLPLLAFIAIGFVLGWRILYLL